MAENGAWVPAPGHLVALSQRVSANAKYQEIQANLAYHQVEEKNGLEKRKTDQIVADIEIA